MRRVRLLIILLVVWLFLFFNMERLFGSLNISGVAYVLVPTMAVVTLLASRLNKVPFQIFLTAPILVFIILKIWEGRPVAGAGIPLTVMEACAILITMGLMRAISLEVGAFEKAVANITLGQVGKLPPTFSEKQGEIYQEVRRARNYQRPLMLMAISVEESSIQVAVDRIVERIQQLMAKQYALSGIAKTLCEETECSMIALQDDHFLVLLPELTPENYPALAARLRKSILEQVGVTLQIGVASLPEDTLTFEGLVDKAVAQMTLKAKLSQPFQGPTVTLGRAETVLKEDLDGHVHS
jgi:GGDEF domain-containing protein